MSRTITGGGDGVRGRFTSAVVWGGVAYSVVAVVFSLVAFHDDLAALAVAFFVGMAAAGSGCVAGFLFGVPQVVGDTRTLPVEQARELASTRLLFNTNLGQISDWVTKIVVGLGLTQFGRVIDGAQHLGTRFADVFGQGALTGAQASAYGLSLVIGALTTSFLLMYMWTATRLPEVWGH